MASGYVTTSGEVFHNDSTCEFLLDGQRRFLGRGVKLPEPQRIGWVDAQARGLGMCRGCCTPQWVKRHSKENLPQTYKAPANGKPCYVLVDGRWRAGRLVWLRRDQNGLWWAEVTYLADSQPVVVIKSQHYVRARQHESN